MIDVVIGKKTYQGPQTWEELKMSKFIKLCEITKEMPRFLQEVYFAGNKKKAKPEQLVDSMVFYRKWVSEICDIPDSTSKKIPMISLIACMKHLEHFLFDPKEDDIMQLESFKFDGHEYSRSKMVQTFQGIDVPMKDSTFIEFVEGTTLKSQLNKIQDGKIKFLPLLTAIIYRRVVNNRIEEYDGDKAKAQAKAFHTLTMDKIYGAYFFLKQQSYSSIKRSRTSLRKMEKRHKAHSKKSRNLAGSSQSKT